MALFGRSDVRAALEAARTVTSLPCTVEERGRGEERSLLVVVDGSGTRSSGKVEPDEVPLVSIRVRKAAQAASTARVSVTTVDSSGTRHAWSTIQEAIYAPGVRLAAQPDTAVAPVASLTERLTATVRFVAPDTAAVVFSDEAPRDARPDVIDLVAKHFAASLLDLGPATPAPELVEAMGLLATHVIEHPADAFPERALWLGIHLVDSMSDGLRTRTVRLVEWGGISEVVIEGAGECLYVARSVLALAMTACEALEDTRLRMVLGQTLAAMASQYRAVGPAAWCRQDNVLAVPARAQALAFETLDDRRLL